MSKYDVPFYEMCPTAHNAIARDDKLALVGIKSDRDVEHFESGLEFFSDVDQKDLVFVHPNGPFITKNHTSLWV